MLQFFFEIIVAVLAVYGGYTALHELAALVCKWIGAPRYTLEDSEPRNRKEDSEDGRDEGSDHAGGDD
ncbi:MAG: hypothetical protein IJX76_05640 [Clostridia bacterium]|nr:hypothetical protein [Clostridia bacterium]